VKSRPISLITVTFKFILKDNAPNKYANDGFEVLTAVTDHEEFHLLGCNDVYSGFGATYPLHRHDR
jgi:hypothetical protein